MDFHLGQLGRLFYVVADYSTFPEDTMMVGINQTRISWTGYEIGFGNQLHITNKSETVAKKG
jgi:hypothetical protein